MKKAFTIIELLVVIAIIAIAAMLFPVLVRKGRGQPVPVQTPVGNLEAPKQPSGYDVQLLFMINGMKIYRFYDNGKYVYVADGRDSKTAWDDTELAGKTLVVVPQEVQTVK